MSKLQNDPLLGSRIREYEILQVIGKGGMGAVYKARHIYLEKERAIKVIKRHLAGEQDFVDRFIREARILTDLNHPNLIHLYDFGTLSDPDIFFMVLEFLQGETVLERTRRLNRIPVSESIRIIREAALGLHSAHSKGIVHRDLSPDNLFLVKADSGREITKVIDFGIAKPNLETTRNITIANMFIGKPEYCSPEQCGLLKSNEMIDRRSDIYSLALTFYFMLTGRSPFEANSIAGYIYKQVNENPKPVSEYLPVGEIPSALDQVIIKALSKKREERHSTMEEFARDLEKIAFPETTSPQAITVVRLSAELQPGDVFDGRYFIEEKLGDGEMGSVYKAVDKILELPVALKMVSTKVLQNEKSIGRFKREVILASKVVHPNVCRIYDIGERLGTHYVSMEFLQGRTLGEELRDRGRMTPEEGVPIIRQILVALHEAHRAGVVHRDLKPQNIMIDNNHRAYIMDFGISASTDVARATDGGVIVENPHYMSPEQFEGKKIDFRSDLYSAGVIMFQMFTGQLPFQADSPMAVIFAHLKSIPLKPTELVPNFSVELEKIILKSIEKEVDQRYQSAIEIHKALEPFAALESTSSESRREAIAHKYLAERSYSKAIDYLNSLLKDQPKNEEWQRLLNNAVNDRNRRDVQRVKLLIRKNNLIQARELIQKIRAQNEPNTRIISLVHKLEASLDEKSENEIQSYLKKIEKLAVLKDWDSAIDCVKEAFTFKPNDERLAGWEKKINELKDGSSSVILRAELVKARSFLESGNFTEAENAVGDVLKKNPGFPTAVKLLEEIQTVKRKKDEEETRIKKSLQKAISSLSKLNFAKSFSVLNALQSEVSDPEFGLILKNMTNLIQQLDTAFFKESFESVPDVLKALSQEDRHGWLLESKEVFELLENEAKKRDQLNRDFQKAFQKGKNLFDQQLWQEAIESWEEAQRILPGNDSMVQWLADAKARLESEKQVKARVESELKKCEKFLIEKELDQLREGLEQAEKIVSEHKLKGFDARIALLYSGLDQALELEHTHQIHIQKDLTEVIQLYKDKNLKQSLQKVEDLLEREPKLDKAIELQQQIQTSIADQEAANKRFKDLFQQGKTYFDSMEWDNGIQLWQEAQKIFPNESSVQQWIEAASSRLRNENHLRSQIVLRIDQCDTFINEKRFDEASSALQQCRQLYSSEYRLQDLNNRISELSHRLDKEIEEEKSRQQKNREDLQNATELFQAGELQQATQILDALAVRAGKLKETEEVRTQILEKRKELQEAASQFNKAFDKGNQLFEELRWQEAIQVWQEALKINSNPTVLERIAEAENRWNEENNLRDELHSSFQRCEDAINQKKFTEANQLLDSSSQKISAQYRIDDLRKRFNYLRDKLADAIKKDNAYRESIQKDLNEARNLFARSRFAQAQEKIASVLNRESGMQEAVELQEQIRTELEKNQIATELSKQLDKLVPELDRNLPGIQVASERLKNIAKGSVYEQQTALIADQLFIFANSLQSGNLIDAQTIAEALAKIPVLERHKNQINKFITKLGKAQIKEQSTVEMIRTVPYLVYVLGFVLLVAFVLLGWFFWPRTTTIVEDKKKDGTIIKQKDDTKKDSDQKDQDKGELNDNAQLEKEKLINSKLSEATLQLQAQNYTRAMELYQEIINIDPANQPALKGLDSVKRLRAKQQELLKQEQEFLKGLQRFDNYFNDGNYNAAEQLLKQLSIRYPNNKEIKLKQQQLQARKDALEKQKDATKIAELLSQSRSMLQNNDLSGAESRAREALRLDPSNTEANRILAQIQNEKQTPKYGKIIVRALPNAKILIDDGKVATATGVLQVLEVKAGTHKITIQRQGFIISRGNLSQPNELTETVQIKPGEEPTVFVYNCTKQQ